MWRVCLLVFCSSVLSFVRSFVRLFMCVRVYVCIYDSAGRCFEDKSKVCGPLSQGDWCRRDVTQMVECSLSMREVQGSIPTLLLHCDHVTVIISVGVRTFQMCTLRFICKSRYS